MRSSAWNGFLRRGAAATLGWVFSILPSTPSLPAFGIQKLDAHTHTHMHAHAHAHTHTHTHTHTHVRLHTHDRACRTRTHTHALKSERTRKLAWRASRAHAQTRVARNLLDQWPAPALTAIAGGAGVPALPRSECALGESVWGKQTVHPCARKVQAGLPAARLQGTGRQGGRPGRSSVILPAFGIQKLVKFFKEFFFARPTM